MADAIDRRLQNEVGGDPSPKGCVLWHIRHYLLIGPNPLRSDSAPKVW